MGELLELLGAFVIGTISSTGYAGIFVLMALESANIPIPSEIIMPFSGFLVAQGMFSFFWVVFWGALGNLAGSLASYYLGLWGGRPFLEKYGKFFFVSLRDLELADRWFTKYGIGIVFLARLLPVVRTFISFPAGIARMNLKVFSLYTFIGSFLWSLLLAFIGLKAGENWIGLETYFRKFDWLIAGLLFVGVAWWIFRHIRSLKS